MVCSCFAGVYFVRNLQSADRQQLFIVRVAEDFFKKKCKRIQSCSQSLRTSCDFSLSQEDSFGISEFLTDVSATRDNQATIDEDQEQHQRRNDFFESEACL